MFFDNHDKPEGRVTTQEKFLAERVINLHIVVIVLVIRNLWELQFSSAKIFHQNGRPKPLSTPEMRNIEMLFPLCWLNYLTSIIYPIIVDQLS